MLQSQLSFYHFMPSTQLHFWHQSWKCLPEQKWLADWKNWVGWYSGWLLGQFLDLLHRQMCVQMPCILFDYQINFIQFKNIILLIIFLQFEYQSQCLHSYFQHKKYCFSQTQRCYQGFYILQFQAKVAFMRQPTTIPQYKQFCKALKLKILKQKTTIQSQTGEIQKLQTQIKILKKSGLQVRNENDPNGAFTSSIRLDKTKNNMQAIDLQSLNGKNQVMNKFKNGASLFGITPESIFRIADFNYKNQVQADYFRQILSKIDLGLSPMEVSCLIYIFDQNCTGFIIREEYHDALNAYQVSLQQSYLQYTNGCLQKLAKLMEADRIDVLKFFQQMEGKTVNSVDLNKFHERIRTTFAKRMLNRQIMGAFNAIDLQNDGIISKKNFVYSLTSAINKLSNQSAIKKSNSYDQQNQFQRSNLSGSGKKSAPNQFLDNNQSNYSTKNIRQKEPEHEQSNHDSSDVLEKIYSNHKINLVQIYQQICQKPLNSRLTLFQFKKILNGIKGQSKINPQLSSLLFKLIDCNQKGTIHLHQLMNFYLLHQTDMSIIFHLISIYFKNNDLNSQRFWNLYGISPDSDISKAKFMQVMGKTFATKQNVVNIWEKLWNYFDKGRGVISVGQVNRQLSKYDIFE